MTINSHIKHSVLFILLLKVELYTKTIRNTRFFPGKKLDSLIPVNRFCEFDIVEFVQGRSNRADFSPKRAVKHEWCYHSGYRKGNTASCFTGPRLCSLRIWSILLSFLIHRNSHFRLNLGLKIFFGCFPSSLGRIGASDSIFPVFGVDRDRRVDKRVMIRSFLVINIKKLGLEMPTAGIFYEVL